MHLIGVKEKQTMKITLEAITSEHGELIQELITDPGIASVLNLPPGATEEETRCWLETSVLSRQKKEAFDFAVLADGDPVGLCGVHKTTGSRAEITLWIGKSHRARGYASGGGQLLVRCAFEDPSQEYLDTHCPLRDRVSERVSTKLGFHLVAVKTLPESRWSGEPLAFFELSREMWEVGRGI